MKKVYVCYRIICNTKLFRTSAHTNIHKQFNNAYYFYSDSKKSKSKVIFLTNFELKNNNRGTFVVSIRKAKKSDVTMIFILKTSEQYPRIKKYILTIENTIENKGRVIYRDENGQVVIKKKSIYDVLIEEIDDLSNKISEIFDAI